MDIGDKGEFELQSHPENFDLVGSNDGKLIDYKFWQCR